MRAAIYTRVSTEDQARDGYGLDVQAEKCLAMATVKEWAVVERFTDDGISGTKDEAERPGLAALVDAIDTGAIDAVIVYSLDRIGRATRLVLRIVDSLTASGVELVSCKESLDTSTATGRFVLRMFASLAELERDNIVERTTAGRDERGKVDGEKGGRVPMGYVRTFNSKARATGVAVDPEAAETVRAIFRWRDAGATLQEIADNLNDAGISTARGSQWHPSSVRIVLGNEDAYRGGPRGESDVHWPEILA